MKKSQLLNRPFWIFWAGLITGALITGLIFSYQLRHQNIQDAVLKGSFKTTTQSNTIDWPGGS